MWSRVRRTRRLSTIRAVTRSRSCSSNVWSFATSPSRIAVTTSMARGSSAGMSIRSIETRRAARVWRPLGTTLKTSLEADARAELHQALLALSRIARKRVRRAGRIEHCGVLRVEQVEDSGDRFDAVTAGETELFRKAEISLRERRAARIVDVRVTRRQILVVAVVIEVRAGKHRVRQRRTVADDARNVDAERCAINAAERHAMTRVGVERAIAGRAVRIERIDAPVAEGIQLEARIGHAELVGAGEDVAARLRVRVEALRFELLAHARVEADVHAVILRVALAVPKTEVRRRNCREATLTGGRVDRVRAEAERNVVIARADHFEVHAEIAADLGGVTERRLIGVRRAERRRRELARGAVGQLARQLVRRKRLARLEERAIRILDAVRIFVAVDRSEERLHRAGGEEDRRVRVREVVVTTDAAADDLLRVTAEVVGEAEARAPVVAVVRQLRAAAVLEVLNVALGVNAGVGEVLDEREVRVQRLVEVIAGPEVITQSGVDRQA